MSGFRAQLESMPGVVEAVLESSASGDQVDLRVQLADSATIEEAEEAGVAAAALRAEPMPPGVYPGRIELRLASSSYGHFAVVSDEVLRAQVAYWMRIMGAGAASVSFGTFSSTLATPASGSAAPEPTSGVPALLNAPAGRFIGVTLPDAGLGETQAIVDRIRGVPDPGANGGEWHFSVEGRDTKTEFASPHVPSADEVALAARIAGAVAPLGDAATLTVRFDETGAAPVAATLTAFDDALDDRRGAAFEAAMRESKIWPAVLGLVDALDAAGADFSLRVLSNALGDSGTFVLGVGVTGCAFVRDPSWPALSDDLASHWLRAHAARYPAQPGCVAG